MSENNKYSELFSAYNETGTVEEELAIVVDSLYFKEWMKQDVIREFRLACDDVYSKYNISKEDRLTIKRNLKKRRVQQKTISKILGLKRMTVCNFLNSNTVGEESTSRKACVYLVNNYLY